MMHGHGLCLVHKAAIGLVWIGAINWGLVGFFEFNLVEELLGTWPVVVRVIYAAVGVAALIALTCCKCKMCKMAK